MNTEKHGKKHGEYAFMLMVMAALFVGGLAGRARAECSEGKKIVTYSTSANPDDTQAPGKVVVTDVLIERGEDTEGTLCISVGSLGFVVQAPEDDVTSSEDLGYVIEWVSGTPSAARLLPPFDQDPNTPVHAQDGTVWVNFTDKRDEALSGSFRIAAIDQAGKQGEFSEPVHVEHPGESSGGCSTSSSASGALLSLLGMLALAITWRWSNPRGKVL